MCDKRTLYQAVWTREDEVVPMTQSEDEEAMHQLVAVMNEKAAEGVEWKVRKVQVVTRPFSVEGEGD